MKGDFSKVLLKNLNLHPLQIGVAYDMIACINR